MGRRLLPAVIALVALCFLPAGVLRGTEPLIQEDDAYITANGSSGWTIGNALMRFTLNRQGGATVVGGITDVTGGHEWSQSNSADGYITVANQRFNLGSTATPLVNASTSEWWGGVRLDLHYTIPSQQLDITRTYACYPASTVIEVWTTYHAGNGRTVTLSDLNNYTLSVSSGTAQWVSGTSTPDESGGPLTRQWGELKEGQLFEIGSDTRSSETAVPWYGITLDDSTEFFGAMLWSGSWRTDLVRHGGTIDVRVGLPVFPTTLQRNATLETPHAIFGFTTTEMPSVSMSMRGFIDHALRHGRPYSSYVSYNTWYSYGTFIDEASLLAEMDLASSLGIEQFVVDAGWWPTLDGDTPGDFMLGWGSYQVDMDRFPDGLSSLSDHAHQLGMRFGLWVEPERVDRATLNQDGAASDGFLAMQDGRYDPSAPNSESRSAQVCFVLPQARDWVTQRLVALIDAIHPDYLKWDNNFWVNCNRPSHNHTGDANFFHMRGVDMVRDDLRSRYPDMAIEDCASGANRLSLDMLAYSDETWVSDRTAPTARVRHNLEGLLDIFPSSYLLSFALSTEQEPMEDGTAADLPNLMRSRMLGAMGMSMFAGSMSDGTRAQVANQISLYKYIRPILMNARSMLLSAQELDYPDTPWSGWDVVEHLSPTTGDAIVMAFDTPDAPSSTLVQPKGLRMDIDYRVESADYGDLGTVHGSDLMSQGIQINQSDLTHSHVIILHAQPASTTRR